MENIKTIKCHVDGKLFATVDCGDNEINNLSKVKYQMEQEVKENGATKASYHVPGLIYGDYDYIDNKWICRDRR
jgi:hypothetical protein